MIVIWCGFKEFLTTHVRVLKVSCLPLTPVKADGGVEVRSLSGGAHYWAGFTPYLPVARDAVAQSYLLHFQFGQEGA